MQKLCPDSTVTEVPDMTQLLYINSQQTINTTVAYFVWVAMV